MELKNLTFESMVSGFQKLNPSVAKVKIHIAYTGKNRNNSSFSKEVLQRMADNSLRGIPVIGEFKKDIDDFGGHGGKVIMDENGIDYVNTTIPYGYVDTDTEVTWETIREKDGLTLNEYLTCTAYLWHGRYPEVEKILENNLWQSMEVEILDYEPTQDNYVEIKDANFSALCILGQDTAPCFESSSISRYSATDMEDFKSQFNLMVKEIRESLSSFEVNDKNNEEGGIEVENEFEEVIVETVVEDTAIVETEEFATEEIEIEEVIQVDFEVIKAEYEAKIAEIEVQVEDYKNKYNAIELENVSLKEYQSMKLAEERQKDEEIIFSQFDEQLTGVEEYKKLKQESSKYSTEDLKEKCFAILGKKNAQFSFNQPKKDTVKVSVNHDDSIDNEIYGGLHNKYLKK